MCIVHSGGLMFRFQLIGIPIIFDATIRNWLFFLFAIMMIVGWIDFGRFRLFWWIFDSFSSPNRINNRFLQSQFGILTFRRNHPFLESISQCRQLQRPIIHSVSTTETMNNLSLCLHRRLWEMIRLFIIKILQIYFNRFIRAISMSELFYFVAIWECWPVVNVNY